MHQDDIFSQFAATHEVGEIRLNHGQTSMCLGKRHYAEGYGYVWATENEAAEFSLKGPICGYLYGICQTVNPKNKSISILMIRGSSWGDFATGNITQIRADDIARYHRPLDIADPTLFEWSRQIESRVQSTEVFMEISERELEAAFRTQFKDVSMHFLGERAYERSLSLFKAYMNFLENIRNSKGNYKQQPSKKLLSSARQVREILGLEGSSISIDEGHIFPKNLSDKSSAAFGAVCGALVGDAAGGVLELLGRIPTGAEVDHALGMPGGGVFSLAPGQITDDGELTICLLKSLAQTEGKYEREQVARSYVDWSQSEPFHIGRSTHNALSVRGSDLRGAANSIFDAAVANNLESKANGALMRITPLGVAAAGLSEEDAVRFARADAWLTHPNSVCLDANAAYVLAIRHLILNPGDRFGAITVAQNYLSGINSEVSVWIRDALSGEIPDASPHAGFVKIAFIYAFFHLNQGSSFRAAIKDTLSSGGDTDTNSCIVGGLMGSYWGINKIINSDSSKKMIYPVIMCDPSLGQNRPEIYHASSVPLLLRRLVEALGIND